MKRHRQRTSLGNRIGRGLVPGGRGFFNRPRIAGRHRGHGGHGGHGGGGGLLTAPLHLLVAGLGMLAKLFKHRKHQTKGAMGRHQYVRHPRQRHPYIHRPRLHKPPAQRHPRTSVASRRASYYKTGVFNVVTRTLKRTRLL